MRKLLIDRHPWYAAVRHRPGMYVGDGAEGLLTLVYSVVSNAVDLFWAGRCTAIDVTLLADGTVRVSDDGPGCAVVGEVPSFVEALTSDGASPVKDRHPRARVWYLDLGLPVVSALSDLVVVTTSWQGRRWRVTASAGELRGPPEDLGLSTSPGTIVEFHPDPAMFPGVVFDASPLVRRLHEVAALCPGLTLRFSDQRVLTLREGPGFHGLLTAVPPEHAPEADRGWLATRLTDARPEVALCARAERPGITVEARIQWSPDPDVGIWSFVNLQPTANGSHVQGLRRGVGALALAFGGTEPVHQRLQRHVIAVVSVIRVEPPSGPNVEPTLFGPRLERLEDREVEQLVADAVEASMLTFVEAQPEEARAILAWLEQEDRGFGDA